MKLSATVIALILSSTLSAHAALESVSVSSDEIKTAPRWIYGLGQPPKVGADVSSLLANVKAAQAAGKWTDCIRLSKQARPKAKSLSAWLAVFEVECATKPKSAVESANSLWASLEHVQSNASWMLTGPQAPRLRTSVMDGYLKMLEQDTKTNRTRAWTAIERLQGLSAFSDSETRAEMWKSAGELAFIQQKLDAARDFFERSLEERESDEIRLRLKAIEAAKAGGTINDIRASVETKQQKAATAVSTLDASKEELDLVDRATKALRQGDIVSAMQDCTKIIRDYPGSVRAKWASDRVVDSIASLADKTEPKHMALREQVISVISKADPMRLAEWARVLFNRGLYAESLTLAKKSLEDLQGAERTRVLEIAADAAIATDNDSRAREYLKELIEKHSGQKASREAILRSGILNYRNGQYALAAADLERVSALPIDESQRVIAQYWLWRSLQKSKSDRAETAARELMTKFPFSYYGLRARFETNKGVLEFKPERKEVKSMLWFTSHERLAWEKIQLLLKAGWLEEAQAELKELPTPLKAEDKAVRSLVWAAAAGYVTASRLANMAWDENPEFRRPPFTDAAFPREFADFVTLQAQNRKMDPDLVRGLIKQESSFNVRAVSSSNAMGLMQMIPPTAKEIAQDLKLGSLVMPEDMFQPSRNVQMGTYYLSRMLDRYNGSVPLALAAYNAGPYRMDRWLASRPSLKDLKSKKSSKPDDEIWIDELPYDETSFYVKAILRNLLLYKALDQGRVEVSNPIWSYKALEKSATK
ncbi:MAG TPA: transglycosylase SLT domain-containing protein [Bdellovibrionales bacterium]|nr:transglycosylase SLT domain-containing protein [Bdellovibrionales bacterium]